MGYILDSNSTAQGRWKNNKYRRELDLSETLGFVWQLFTGYHSSTSRPGWCVRDACISQAGRMETSESKSLIISRHIKTKATRKTIWLLTVHENSAPLEELVLLMQGEQGPEGGGAGGLLWTLS